MAEKVKCVNCGKEFDRRGLRMHNQIAHPKIEQSEVHQKPEESTIIADCPHCQRKNEEIEKLNSQIEQMRSVIPEKESQKDLELNNLMTRVRGSQGELDRQTSEIEVLQRQLTAAQANVGVIPDLDEVIAHCESGRCPRHEKQWNDTKVQIVQGTLDNVPDSFIRSEMDKRGILPERIALSDVLSDDLIRDEMDKRGVLPNRIVIRR